jgi:DNA repair exonuclease SbcCD ATPase subunit
MSIASMDLPDIGRYRRRFIVEFGPEDSGLIDRMGLAHRTKRAAIIAGLRLLESGELEQLRAQVATLEAKLATTKAAGTAAKLSAATTARLDKAKADLAAERTAHRRTQRALDKAQAALTDTQAALTRAQKDLADSQGERERLAALLPHHTYCRYCDKLVPEAEWAEQATAEGVDVYHQPDGYRAKGSLISGPTTVLLQRHAPGQATR